MSSAQINYRRKVKQWVTEQAKLGLVVDVDGYAGGNYGPGEYTLHVDAPRGFRFDAGDHTLGFYVYNGGAQLCWKDVWERICFGDGLVPCENSRRNGGEYCDFCDGEEGMSDAD